MGSIPLSAIWSGRCQRIKNSEVRGEARNHPKSTFKMEKCVNSVEYGGMTMQRMGCTRKVRSKFWPGSSVG